MSEKTPYYASYAKSNSAFCVLCKEVFAKDTLQLSIKDQADVKSDVDTNYFHLNCFFTKEKPKSIQEIGNFDTLLKEDQKEVKSKIDENIALAEAELNGLKSSPEMRDFFIEYAKSTSAGFLSACDDRFRNVLKDDDYLTDSLPQEFSDVLKRLDLKDDSVDDCEFKSDKTSSSITEEKSKENLLDNMDTDDIGSSAKKEDKQNLKATDEAMKVEF